MDVVQLCVDHESDANLETTLSLSNPSPLKSMVRGFNPAKERSGVEENALGKPGAQDLDFMTHKANPRDTPASISGLSTNPMLGSAEKVRNYGTLCQQLEESSLSVSFEGSESMRVRHLMQLDVCKKLYEPPATDECKKIDFSHSLVLKTHPSRRFLMGSSINRVSSSDSYFLKIEDVEDIFPEESRKLSFSRSFGDVRQHHNSILANSGLHMM